jgi:hypothetical protein
MDRRKFSLFLVSLLAIPISVASAQSSSPEAGTSLLEGLGLPILEVTVSVDGIDAPAEIAAGPVLLVAHNATDGGLTVDLTQLPDGVMVDDYLTIADSDDGSIPAWAADLVLAGYASTPPIGTSTIVLNLAPGTWTLIADGDADLAETSVTLTVTGEAPADAGIAADVELEYGEYTFGVPATIAAGPQIWHVTNVHTVPHHAIVFPVDRLYTADEAHSGAMAAFSGSPVADGFSMETSVVGPPTEFPVITAGQEFWLEVDLAPGFYVALCFVADPGTIMPHVLQGMIATFEVK